MKGGSGDGERGDGAGCAGLGNVNPHPIAKTIINIIAGTTFATILNNPIIFAQENDPICPPGRDGA